MSNFVFCLNAVLPSFLLIASGFLVRAIGLMDEIGIKQLNRLCFHLLLPLVMFKTAYTSNFSQDFDIRLLIISVCCIIIMIFAMTLVASKITDNRGQIGVMVQASFRSNAVLMGIPFAISLCGESAAGPTAVLVAFIVPIYNLLAVTVLSIYNDSPNRKTDALSVFENVIKNPLIIAAILGFALSAINLQLPQIVQKPIFSLAAAGSTIAMLAVGAQLNFKNAVKNIRLTAVVTFAKLIVLPIVGTAAAIMLGLRGSLLCAPFLILSMPAATGTASLADVMGADGNLAAEIVVFSTAVSVVTIFAGSFLLKSLALI